MEKYIINNKTVGILKKNNKTIIYDVDKYNVFNKSINKIIEESCNYYGTSLNGAKKSAINILDIKYKVPLVIENNKNIILIQLNSFRSKDTLFLAFDKIIDYKYSNKYLYIYCYNNNQFKIKLSKNCFEKLLINAVKLNNILKYRKS